MSGSFTARVFSEAHLICSDGDGRERFATQRNLGYSAERGGYVSQFMVNGVAHYAVFKSPYHEAHVCPDPAQRLSFDLAFLEENLGLLLIDAEAVELA